MWMSRSLWRSLKGSHQWLYCLMWKYQHLNLCVLILQDQNQSSGEMLKLVIPPFVGIRIVCVYVELVEKMPVLVCEMMKNLFPRPKKIVKMIEFEIDDEM